MPLLLGESQGKPHKKHVARIIPINIRFGFFT